MIHSLVILVNIGLKEYRLIPHTSSCSSKFLVGLVRPVFRSTRNESYCMALGCSIDWLSRTICLGRGRAITQGAMRPLSIIIKATLRYVLEIVIFVPALNLLSKKRFITPAGKEWAICRQAEESAHAA